MKKICVIVATLAIVAGLAACKSAGASSSAEARKYDAFDACTHFVKNRLKAPGTATFRDPTANNGDTTFSGTDNSWTIDSSVDSENGFGASLRSTFTCSVVSPAGDNNWTLSSLNVVDGGDIGG